MKEMSRGGGSRKGNETSRDGQKKSQRKGKEIARDDDRPSSPVQSQTAEPLLRDACWAALNAARSSQDNETPAQSNVGVGVRGSSRPFDPLPANRRLDTVFRHGTFLGEEVPSYFLQAVKKLNIKFWPRYVSIDRDVIENIWKGLKIIRELNRKKNQETQEPTKEFIDPNKKAVILEYIAKFKEIYGEDIDPNDVSIVKSLWTSIETVQRGLSKGRVYGVGSSSSSSQMIVDHPTARPPLAPDQTMIDEITRSIRTQVQADIQLKMDQMRQQLAAMQQLIAQMQMPYQMPPQPLPAETPAAAAPPPVVSSVRSSTPFIHQLHMQQIQMPMMSMPHFPVIEENVDDADDDDEEEGDDEDGSGQDED